MQRNQIRSALVVIILSLGMYQLIAALLAAFLLFLGEEWQDFLPQIAGIAFWLNFPITFWVWHRWLRRGKGHRE